MSASKPKISFDILKGETRPRFNIADPYEVLERRYEFQTKIIIAIFAIAIVTLLFMVATLLLDVLHFNSVVYKEYSEKTDTLNALQESNKALLEQNKQNQLIITGQNDKILELLKNLK
jgi:CHASE3 domain sensor protein